MSLRKILLILFVLLTPYLSVSQRIVGRITDTQGNPVPYATIFVKEMNKGLASNDKGFYQINVESGTFTVKFQSIGFKAYSQVVKVGTSDVTLNVQLEEAVYNLSQVTVSSKDNPALWITRKAIALGQQYKRSVAAYNSDIYIKGNFNVRKYSRLLKFMTPKSIDIPKEGKTYFAEMFTKVNFRAPDTYSQRIVSFRSTLPGADSRDNFPGLEFLNTSIYDNSFGDIPSPLGLNAFSYYNYSLVGSSLDNNVPVYKIMVTPKRPSGKFFKGFLYIADNTYAVKNADLTFEMSFGMANFKIAFDLIAESAVLPTGYQLFADGGLLGSSGWIKSSGSLKYSNVAIIGQQARTKPRPAATDENLARKIQEKKAEADRKRAEKEVKRQEKIDKLINKTAMTKSDMNKLAKLVKEEEEAKRPDTLKTLELHGLDKVEFSDDFNQKDSSYWASFRPIPLEEEEKAAYVKVDSVRSFKDRLAAFENLTRTGEKVTPLAFATGGYLYRGKGLDIKTKGLFNPNYTYFNPIDGFTVGSRFAIFKDLAGSREISSYLIPMYSFNRQRAMGVGSVGILLFPRKMAWFTVGGTYASADINSEQPVQPLVNTFTSLFLKDSYTRAMDVRGGYAKLSYELANGLTAEAQFSYYNRELVANSTNFSFLKRSKDFEENTPVNEYLSTHPLTNHKQASVEASLTYTPVQYYRMDGDRKRYVRSDYPTFQMLYRRGVLSESASQYTLLKAASWKRWDLGFLSEFWYKVEGGTFLNSKNLQLPDFYFPKVDYLPVTFQPTKQSFHLIPYYQFATPGWFVEGHMLYEADNIIVKQLPFFKGTVFTENLYLSYFNSKQLRNYVEVGYGIDKIFILMEVKGIVGFEDGKFRSVGLSISFNRD